MILGLSRNDVRRKFDDIVAFAELEEFIDVPVKYYYPVCMLASVFQWRLPWNRMF